MNSVPPIRFTSALASSLISEDNGVKGLKLSEIPRPSAMLREQTRSSDGNIAEVIRKRVRREGKREERVEVAFRKFLILGAKVRL